MPSASCTKKRIAPRLFDRSSPILYAWPFDAGADQAGTIAAVEEPLHTLGLGFDAAYALGEAVSWGSCESAPKWDPGTKRRMSLIELSKFVRPGVPIGAVRDPGANEIPPAISMS